MEPCILQNLKLPLVVMIVTTPSNNINMYDEEVESSLFYKIKTLFFLTLYSFYSLFKTFAESFLYVKLCARYFQMIFFFNLSPKS